MNEYLTKLTELQREAAEITRHKDPDLSPEGQDKAEKRARAALKTNLEALTREFNKEAEETKRVAAAAIPGGNGNTRQHWERAKMLLEAGATLRDIVSKADAPMLHAVQEWAPLTSKLSTSRLARKVSLRWRQNPSTSPPLTIRCGTGGQRYWTALRPAGSAVG